MAEQDAAEIDAAGIDAAEIVKVLVVDDEVMFAESIARLLASEPGIDVVGTAATSAGALEAARHTHPDVVLIDFRLPDVDGVETTARLKCLEPDVKVVMVTGVGDPDVMVRAIEAGCSGFISKGETAARLAEAVRGAAQGEAVMEPAMLSRLLPRLRGGYRSRDRLTRREHEVLELMAEGLTNAQIAERIFLSANTVRNHTQNILSKLDAHSKLEAVSVAVRQGIIEYGMGTAPVHHGPGTA